MKRNLRKNGIDPRPTPQRPPPDPEHPPVAGVAALPPLDSVPPFPRVREGPHVARASSPAWDLTHLRVRREEKDDFEVLRLRWSTERVLPHWEVFARVMQEYRRRGLV